MLPIFPEEMRIREQKSEVRGQKTQPTPIRLRSGQAYLPLQSS